MLSTASFTQPLMLRLSVKCSTCVRSSSLIRLAPYMTMGSFVWNASVILRVAVPPASAGTPEAYVLLAVP